MYVCNHSTQSKVCKMYPILFSLEIIRCCCCVYFTSMCFVDRTCTILILILQVSKTLVINGRNGLLGDQRNNTFSDVACGRGINSDITYCVTSSGLLCSINSKRVLDTWVELKVRSWNCFKEHSVLHHKVLYLVTFKFNSRFQSLLSVGRYFEFRTLWQADLSLCHICRSPPRGKIGESDTGQLNVFDVIVYIM